MPYWHIGGFITVVPHIFAVLASFVPAAADIVGAFVMPHGGIALDPLHFDSPTAESMRQVGPNRANNTILDMGVVTAGGLVPNQLSKEHVGMAGMPVGRETHLQTVVRMREIIYIIR
jgi:hypothetical protein